jgi:hypothetical protein
MTASRNLRIFAMRSSAVELRSRKAVAACRSNTSCMRILENSGGNAKLVIAYLSYQKGEGENSYSG